MINKHAAYLNLKLSLLLLLAARNKVDEQDVAVLYVISLEEMVVKDIKGKGEL